MKKILKLIIFSLFLLPLTAQELVVENYGEEVDIWVLMPYDLFQFGRDADEAEYSVSTQIKDSRNRQVVVSESNLMIPNKPWLKGTAIPLFQQHSLSAGTHSLNITLRNRQLGDRQTLNRSFFVGTQATEIGQAYLIAEREGFRFVPSDVDLQEMDSLSLRLSFALAPDVISLYLDETKHDFIDPISPLELDIGTYAENDSISEIKLSLTEINIRYNLEPLLYGPWFSYNQRYSLKDQIDQLRYIATQNEWRVLSRVPKDKYASAIESFWQAHDPTPGTIRNENREYFYQRVIKADELFTIHRRMVGWKSDRGRIYIKFGEPDQIVNDAFPIGRPPSIRWHYFRLNREFIFTDDRGFGQYRLRNKDDEYLDK